MEKASLSPHHSDLEYRFRPSPIGGESVFRLTADALEFENGRRKSRVRYADAIRLRLSYRPANLAARRFLAEVWPRGGGKLSIASVSAKGPFNFESQGEAYRTFIMELADRIVAAQPAFMIEAGMPWWRWAPAALFGAITFTALIYLLITALYAAKLSFILICLVLGGILAWQISAMLFRNRPRSCGLNSIPAGVLPGS